MRGSYGLVLVLFGVLVELARVVNIPHLRDLPVVWVQAIDLLALFGLAWTMAAVVVRELVGVVRGLSNDPMG